ncbi:MAG: GNAT family N-acetyltransferase [Bacteroidota bacterium]
MIILETQRLVLREWQMSDAALVLQLLNDPGWLRFIGDRGIKNLPQAEAYIRDSLRKSYVDHGFGLYAIERKEDGAIVGMCGLIKRPQLDDVDIGYALLEQYTGQAYALEAAEACLEYGLYRLNIPRILAITDPDNARSIHLLQKLGMTFEKKLQIFAGEITSLFAINA